MRLKESEIEVIKKAVLEYLGTNAKVYLFGSRIDDNKKGGDIDIYIETDEKEDVFLKKIKILVELKKKLGEQKIDVIINNNSYNKVIYQIAKKEGVKL